VSRAADGLPSDLVRSLYQTRMDGLGRHEGRLARLDPRNANARIVRWREGWAFDEVIHQILEDADGRSG
jgi:hypothetical protein